MGKHRRRRKKHDNTETTDGTKPDESADGTSEKGENSRDTNNGGMSRGDRPGRLKSFLVSVFPKEPVARFTALIFVATTVYAGTSIFQLRALQQSNELANRAWLTLKDTERDATKYQEGRLLVTPGSHTELTVHLQNTGKSPAQDVRVSAGTIVQARNWPIPDELTPPSEVDIVSVSVVGPNQDQNLTFRRRVPLTQDEADRIKAGTAVVYFIGNVTYSDPFSHSRGLWFCLLYERSLGDPPTRLRVCGSHNKAW